MYFLLLLIQIDITTIVSFVINNTVMAHSCKDKNKCILKYTSFLFLLTSFLAYQQKKNILAGSLMAIFLTSIMKYWFPHDRHDKIDMVVV